MSAILYDISAFLHYTIERADGQVDQVVSIVRAHIWDVFETFNVRC